MFLYAVREFELAEFWTQRELCFLFMFVSLWPPNADSPLHGRQNSLQNSSSDPLQTLFRSTLCLPFHAFDTVQRHVSFKLHLALEHDMCNINAAALFLA